MGIRQMAEGPVLVSKIPTHAKTRKCALAFEQLATLSVCRRPCWHWRAWRMGALFQATKNSMAQAHETGRQVPKEDTTGRHNGDMHTTEARRSVGRGWGLGPRSWGAAAART